MNRAARLVFIAASLAVAACKAPAQRASTSSANAVVAKGAVVPRLLLTGELDAVTSESLVVPRTPQYNLSIRWLEADGARVTTGQKVAEFDNSAFTANLAEQKLNAAQSANDLHLQELQNEITSLDKKWDLDKARLTLEKATLEAAVDPATLPKRVHQTKQLELERARVAVARATDDLEAHLKSAALDIKVRQIALDKARREIQAAEQAIESVVLRAPRDGIVVIADHPWEGRKLEVGDNAWVGLAVARLPDLGAMKVKALLSDVDDGHVTAGMSAVAFLDAHPTLEFPGTITEVSPVAREPSQKSWRRSFLVTMMLARTDPSRMLPGMSVRVEVEGKRHESDLVAPRGSVDTSVRPPRLRLADSTTIELLDVACDAQRCAIHPAPATAGRIHEGLPLGLGGEGS